MRAVLQPLGYETTDFGSFVADDGTVIFHAAIWRAVLGEFTGCVVYYDEPYRGRYTVAFDAAWVGTLNDVAIAVPERPWMICWSPPVE